MSITDEHNMDVISFFLKEKHKIELLLINSNNTYQDILHSKNIISIINPIKYLLSPQYTSAIYGIIDYQFDNNIDNLLNSNQILNNTDIVKQLFENNKLTDFWKQNNYGFLRLYQKNEKEIVDMKTIYFMPNINFNFINNFNTVVPINYDSLSESTIISYIYNININVSPYSFILNNIITKKQIEEYNKDNIEIIIYNYEMLLNSNQTTLLNVQTIELLRDFSHIYKYKQLNIIDNVINDYVPYQQIYDYNFTAIFLNKNKFIYGKYDEELIINNYGYSLEHIVNELKSTISIHANMLSAITNIIELLLIIYIDIYDKKDIIEIPIEFKHLLTSNNIINGMTDKLIIRQLTINMDDNEYIQHCILNLLESKTIMTIFTILTKIKIEK